MKTIWTFFLIGLVIPLFAQTSVNITGSRTPTTPLMDVVKLQQEWVLFSSTDQLSLKFFHFQKEHSQMLFKISNGTTEEVFYGNGGIVENDSTFVLLGRVRKENVALLKVTRSGRILWSNYYNTGTDEHPDKIIRLNNGDYLISVRTNVSYYEFGEWGSRSGVMRVDENGKLKWFRLLDYRSANTSSVIAGMHELPGGNLILSQSYSSNMGWFKLNAEGDSLKSLISQQGFAIAASDYNGHDLLAAVSSDKKVVTLDTMLNVIQASQISSTSLNSFNHIRMLRNGHFAIGGKYLNDAALLYCDSAFHVIRASYKRFNPSTNSTLNGIFMDNDTICSLIYPGMAFTKHGTDLTLSCFNMVNGSLLTTSDISKPVLIPHIPIKGSATYDALTGVVASLQNNIQPSANCYSYDVSVLPDKNVHERTCPEVSLKLYLTNQGTQNIQKVRMFWKINDQLFDSIFNFSAMGVKQSIFIQTGNFNLKDSITKISGWVQMPNDNADQFPYNDSFEIVYSQFRGQNAGQLSYTQVCTGKSTSIACSGKAGVYDWYLNHSLVKNATASPLSVNIPGKYFVREKDSTCFYYSDTIDVTFHPLPIKPSLYLRNDTLFSDATLPNYWLKGTQVIDSNRSFMLLQGEGSYTVVARNEWGCETVSDPVITIPGNIEAFLGYAFSIKQRNKCIEWLGNKEAELSLFNLNGRRVEHWNGQTIQKCFSDLHGIYILQVKDGSYLHRQKVCLLQ